MNNVNKRTIVKDQYELLMKIFFAFASLEENAYNNEQQHGTTDERPTTSTTERTVHPSWVCLDRPRVCLGMHRDAASSAASNSIEDIGSALGIVPLLKRY